MTGREVWQAVIYPIQDGSNRAKLRMISPAPPWPEGCAQARSTEHLAHGLPANTSLKRRPPMGVGANRIVA